MLLVIAAISAFSTTTLTAQARQAKTSSRMGGVIGGSSGSMGGPVDIYLLHDRICRQCTYQSDRPGYVRLTNAQGQTGIYPANEIVGLDTHPIARKLLKRSFEGMGLAGEIIAPDAFEPEYHFYDQYDLDSI